MKLNFLSCAADQDDVSLVSACWLSGKSTFLALDSKGELHVFSEQLLSWTSHCGIHTTFIILQFSTCRIQCSIHFNSRSVVVILWTKGLKYRRNYFAERRAITTTPEMGCYCAFVQSTRTASASTVNTLYNLSLWTDYIQINIPQFAHSTL